MSEEITPLLNMVNLYLKNFRNKEIQAVANPKIDLTLHNLTTHLVFYDSQYIIPCRFTKNAIDKFFNDYPGICFLHNCDRKITLINYKLNLIQDPKSTNRDPSLELIIESFETDFGTNPIIYDNKGKEIINDQNPSLKSFFRKIAVQSKEAKGSESQPSNVNETNNTKNYQTLSEVIEIQNQIYKEKNKELPIKEAIPVPKPIPGRDFPEKPKKEKKAKAEKKPKEPKPPKVPKEPKKPKDPKVPKEPKPKKPKKEKAPDDPNNPKPPKAPKVPKEKKPKDPNKSEKNEEKKEGAPGDKESGQSNQ